MKAITIPEMTLRLLRAVQSTRQIRGYKERVERVVITGERIDYLPRKSRFTSAAIEREGIADEVQCYAFEKTRPLVAGQFRAGTYDVTGRDIIVIS